MDEQKTSDQDAHGYTRIRVPCLESFLCPICLEEVSMSEASRFSSKPESCPHLFCRACLGAYLTNLISEGKLTHQCPLLNQDGCECYATFSDLTHLTTSDTIARFERFRAMRSDDSIRECPKCNKLVKGDNTIPAMTCPDCEQEFCFFHSTAHQGMSCQEYTRKTARETALNQRVIEQTSQRCPSCNASTEKNGGCNKIRCVQCNVSWCWLCRKPLEPNHYALWNNDGCPGGEFSRVRRTYNRYQRTALFVKSLFDCVVAIPLVCALYGLWVAFTAIQAPFALMCMCATVPTSAAQNTLLQDWKTLLQDMLVGSLLAGVFILQGVYLVITLPYTLVLLTVLDPEDVFNRVCPTAELWAQVYDNIRGMSGLTTAPETAQPDVEVGLPLDEMASLPA